MSCSEHSRCTVYSLFDSFTRVTSLDTLQAAETRACFSQAADKARVSA